MNAHAKTQHRSAGARRHGLSVGMFLRNRSVVGGATSPRRPKPGGFGETALPDWRITFLLFFILCAAPARGESSPDAAGRLPANRYLLAVETSKPMQRRAEGAFKVVQDLFESGFGQQLRPGDSVGLWTWNDSLYTGKFPLQQWSEEKRKEIAGKVDLFLRTQKFEKTPKFEKVLPPLKGVLDNSEYLTVVLVASGESAVQETGFDEQINAYFKRWRKEQQDARMPFVVVLRAEQGKWVSHTVGSAPWPPDMPPMPAELLAAPAAPAIASNMAAPALPPLILSGGKPERPAASPALPTEIRLTPDGAIVVSTNLNLPRPTPGLVETTVTVPSVSKAVTTIPAEVKAPEPVRPIVPQAATNLLAEVKAPEAVPLKPLPVPAPGIAATQAAPPTPKPAVTAASKPQMPAPARPAATSAPPTAVAVPAPEARKGSGMALMLGAGLAGLVCILCVCWALRRRSRKKFHISLITESFDKTRR